MAADAHDDEVGVDEVGFLHDLLGGRADGVVHLDVELRVAEQGAHGREEAFGFLGVVVLDRERLEARDHALRHGMLREEDRDLRSGAEQVGAGGQEFNGAQAVFGAVDGNENVHKFTSSVLFASSADRRQAGPERGTSYGYHACFFCSCVKNAAILRIRFSFPAGKAYSGKDAACRRRISMQGKSRGPKTQEGPNGPGALSRSCRVPWLRQFSTAFCAGMLPRIQSRKPPLLREQTRTLPVPRNLSTTPSPVVWLLTSLPRKPLLPVLMLRS